MSKLKSGLSVFYWLASLGLVAGAAFLLFGGPELLNHGAVPPQPAVSAQPPPPPAGSAVQPAEKRVPIVYAGARTSKPLGEDTRFYQRKEFLAGDARRKYPLTYYLYAPAKPYPDGLSFPLVLVLHDVHGLAPAGEFLIEGDMPVKYPAFVVVPVLPFALKWSMPQDFPEMQDFHPLTREQEGIRDAAQLITLLKKTYPVDPKRIYVIGCADGGFGAFGAALHYPGMFAAAVPIGSGWAAEDAKGFSKVPLWIFHGAQDPYNPAEWSRSAASYIRAYGGKAVYTEVPNVGQNCAAPQFYTPTLWQWLFSQHK